MISFLRPNVNAQGLLPGKNGRQFLTPIYRRGAGQKGDEKNKKIQNGQKTCHLKK